MGRGGGGGRGEETYVIYRPSERVEDKRMSTRPLKDWGQTHDGVSTEKVAHSVGSEQPSQQAEAPAVYSRNCGWANTSPGLKGTCHTFQELPRRTATGLVTLKISSRMAEKKKGEAAVFRVGK